MTNLDVHYSSKTNEWETPQNLFDMLNKIYRFNLDPCASQNNAKCYKFFSEEQDGLSQSWSRHIVFMNPPYGRRIGKWIEKAYNESQDGRTTVVALIPARTDTAYWHKYVMKAHSIQFIRGRVKFGGSKNSAPFPSAVVVFSKNYDKFYDEDAPGISSMELPK